MLLRYYVKPLIDICVVSAQPFPNLIPIFQRKPHQLVLLVSKDMRDTAAHRGLLKALHKQGYDKEKAKNLHEILDFPSGNPKEVEERGLEIFADLKERHPDARLALNLTGGTKLMALALLGAFEAAADLRVDDSKTADDVDSVIYTDTAQGVIHVLKPALQQSHVMQSVLDIPLYFAAANFPRLRAKACRSDIPAHFQQRKAITKYLANHCDKLEYLFRAMNQLYAGNDSEIKPQTLSNSPWGEVKVALDKLKESNLIDWDGNFTVTPMNEDARRYLTGGWLEEFAFWAAVDQGADHVMLEVTFDDNQTKKETPNEFDVVVVHNNRMLVVECKTGRFGQNLQKDADIIYKLESLKNLAGGALATGLLVSAMPLNHTTQRGDEVFTRERAERHHLATIEQQQLRNLPEKMRHWRDTGQLK